MTKTLIKFAVAAAGVFAVGLLFMLLSAANASAATYYYVGSDGDFATAANWHSAEKICDGAGDGSVPGSADTVYFTNSCAVSVTIPASTELTHLYTDANYGGTLTQAGLLTLSGNITLNTSATLDSAGYNLKVAGDWLNTNGTYTSGANTVTFDGSAAQTITTGGATDGKDFNDVRIDNTDTASLAGNLDVDGTFTVTSGGEFDSAGYDVTIVGAVSNEGTIIFDGDETLSLTMDSDSGTVMYDGQGGTYTELIAGDAYYNIEFDDGAVASSWTLDAALDVDGTFTITAGTFNTSTYDVAIAGAFTNGDEFVAGAQTVTFNGTSGNQNVVTGGTAVTQDFNNVAVNNSGTAVNLMTNAIDIDGTLTVTSGIFNLNGQNTTVVGAISNDGTIRLTGAETVTLTAGMDTDSGTVLYAGNGGASLGALAAGDAYYNLTIDDGGSGDDWTLDAALDVDGDFTLTGGTVATGTNNINFAGAYENSDTMTIGSNTIVFDGTSGTQLVTTGGVGANADFNNVDINNSGTSVSLDDAAIKIAGTFDISAGVFDLNGQNLEATGAFTNDATLQLEGGETVVLTAGMDYNSGTVKFDGTSTYTGLPAGFVDTGKDQFYNVNFAGSGTYTMDSTLDVDGTFTIGSGVIVDMDSNTLTVTGANSNDGTLKLEGDETVTFTAAWDINSGTVTYNGTGVTATDLVGGDTYYNLTFDDATASSYTLDATLNVDGALTITGGTLVTGGNAITIAGNFTNSDTFTHGDGTVTLDGTSQTLNGSTTFYDLTKTVSSADTLTLTAGDTYTIANDLTLQGASGELLTLASSSAGTAYTFTVTGAHTLDYLSVSDMTSGGGTLFCYVGRDGCVDGGSNVNVRFSTGQSSSTSTTSSSNIVTVETPNGGEEYSAGEEVAITWASSGDTISYVKIDLYVNGTLYENIVASTDDDGSYTWTVPDLDVTSAKVRVTSYDASDVSLANDLSNYEFEISGTGETVIEDTTEEEVLDETGDGVVEMRRTDGQMVALPVGALFRGETLSGVYIVNADNTRSVFPNEDVFFSYGYSFDNVTMVYDNELSALALGDRVRMAGGELVKIQSNPKVYEVQDDGTIRHVPDEATAAHLYGPNWNQQITDINVVFWFDYTEGLALDSVL